MPWAGVSLAWMLAGTTLAATRLEIQMVPMLKLTGEPGSTNQIQYVTNLSQTNGWITLTNIVLSNTPSYFFDTSGAARRYYQAVLLKDAPTTNNSPANPDPARLVWIPPGTFAMGSPVGEQDRHSLEGPQTVVTLTKGFYMGKYEVTQQEYLAVKGYNPSYFTAGRVVTTIPPPAVLPPPLAEDLSRPVESLNWHDAENYCSRLTEQERAAGKLPTGWMYRLPTEAQWEYACRAGTKTRFYYGDDASYSQLENYAWYSPAGSNMTHPVGQKQPNAWGLYDMAGNVGEWCLDRYASYPGGSVTDPQGPSLGTFQVLRGGSWFYQAGFCRSAYRYYTFPDYADGNIGFRVVLVPGQP
jgi:formylglycine-generating enzyme required for sulfatase activity